MFSEERQKLRLHGYKEIIKKSPLGDVSYFVRTELYKGLVDWNLASGFSKEVSSDYIYDHLGRKWKKKLKDIEPLTPAERILYGRV